jgi:cell division protein FtsB
MPKIRIQFKKQYLVSLLGLCVLIFISVPLGRNIVQRYKVDQEIAELEREIASHQTKADGLKKAVDFLKSDQFVEEQARQNMGLKKPGEEAVVIKDFQDVMPLVASNSPAVFTIPGLDKAPVVKEKTNFSRWWSYFFTKENI